MTPEDEMDHTPLGFGKYAGKTPDQVSQLDPGYVIWLYEQCKPQTVSRLLYEACREDENDNPEAWENPHF